MSEPATNLSFPPFHIPANVDLLYRGQTIVPLERRAVQVLRFLAEHHDRVVTKDELLEAVWPDTFTTDGVLKRAVSQARRALGDGVGETTFIETYHGQGYRFVAPVTRTTATGNAAKQKPEPSPINTSESVALRATDTFAQFRPKGIDPSLPHYNQFIGRDAEFALLQSEYRRRLEGAGNHVMLIGEAGIGKTQLGQQFKRWSRVQGAMCLSARFFDYLANRLAPFEILLDMLRKALCGNKEGGCDLRALAMTKLNVTLPEELFLEMPPLTTTQTQSSSTTTGQFGLRRNTGAFSNTKARAIMPISQCFIRLSQRSPLVLIFDDLQWADDASLDVIASLMRTMQNEPLMIVGLARMDAAIDNEHRLRVWLKEQANYRSFTALTLKPLDEIAFQQTIEAVFQHQIEAPPNDLQTLYRITDGNPHFLIEMLRLLVAERAITYSDARWHWHGIKDVKLPDTVVMAAQNKLERLSDEEREMVECAAVLGEEFRVDALAKVADKSEDEIDKLLLDCVRRGVLSDRGVSAGHDGRFYSTILRRVVYDQIPPRRRKRLHLLAAQSIEAIHAHDPERVAEAISVHYEAAGDLANTFHWSMRAWQATSSRWHWDEAMSNIERAQRAANEFSSSAEPLLPVVDKLKLLFGIGETYYATGRLQESEAAYNEVIALATALQDRGALADALLHQGQTRIGLNLHHEAKNATEQALEIYQQMNDQEGLALALTQLGDLKTRQGN